MVTKIIGWSNIWIYVLANLLGGAAAAYLFNESHAKVRSDTYNESNRYNDTKR